MRILVFLAIKEGNTTLSQINRYVKASGYPTIDQSNNPINRNYFRELENNLLLSKDNNNYYFLTPQSETALEAHFQANLLIKCKVCGSIFMGDLCPICGGGA